MNNNEEISFAESEHLGGFHDTFQEHCSECARENRLMRSYSTVNQEISEHNENSLRGGLFGNSTPWDRE